MYADIILRADPSCFLLCYLAATEHPEDLGRRKADGRAARMAMTEEAPGSRVLPYGMLAQDTKRPCKSRKTRRVCTTALSSCAVCNAFSTSVLKNGDLRGANTSWFPKRRGARAAKHAFHSVDDKVAHLMVAS